MQRQSRLDIIITEQSPHFFNYVFHNMNIRPPLRHKYLKFIPSAFNIKPDIFQSLNYQLLVILRTKQFINLICSNFHNNCFFWFGIFICHCHHFKSIRQHPRTSLCHGQSLIWWLPLGKPRNRFRENPVRHLSFTQIIQTKRRRL